MKKTRSNKKRAHPTRNRAKRTPVITNPLMDTDASVSGNEHSPTPVESDLLVYLSAHTNPPKNIIDGYTVFSIETDEYLRGIVRLVQSDCPEICTEIGSFLNSMARAFIEVTNPGGTVCDVSYTDTVLHHTPRPNPDQANIPSTTATPPVEVLSTDWVCTLLDSEIV
jgi:hypothetical protein